MNSVQVCCGEFIRIILFVLNFIFWAAGGGILGVGIYVLVSLEQLKGMHVSHDTLHSSAIFLVVLGCTVFVVGLLGCCGSLTQNRCMLLLYFTLVTIIFLGEIALAIAVYAKKDAVTESIKEQFEDCMDKYDGESDKGICKDTIDTLQNVLHCCGESKPEDWKNQTNYTVHPPTSCCADENTCTTYDDAYKVGCYPVISDFVNKNAKYIGLGALGVAIVELMGMCLACYLRTFIMKREEYEPYTV